VQPLPRTGADSNSASARATLPTGAFGSPLRLLVEVGDLTWPVDAALGSDGSLVVVPAGLPRDAAGHRMIPTRGSDDFPAGEIRAAVAEALASLRGDDDSGAPPARVLAA
jgi:hypothetical protein